MKRAKIALVLLLFGCSTMSRAPPDNGSRLPRFQENSDATYRIDSLISRGHGSGIVVSKEGHILTAAHVISSTVTSFGIMIDEGGKVPTMYPVTIIAQDPKNDLALVKINRHFSSTALLGKNDDAFNGDAVYNIGYPDEYGEATLHGFIVKAHLSIQNPNITLDDSLLIDMRCDQGISGSGVFSQTDGKLLGIASHILAKKFPPIMFCVFISSSSIRTFLDHYHVPYVSE